MGNSDENDGMESSGKLGLNDSLNGSDMLNQTSPLHTMGKKSEG